MFCSDVEAPAALSQSWTAVGTIWGVSKPGGQNIKKCLQLRNTHPLRSRFSGHSREADLVYTWGRPMTQGKKQVSAPCGTAGCTYLFLPLRHRHSPGVHKVGFPRMPAKTTS